MITEKNFIQTCPTCGRCPTCGQSGPIQGYKWTCDTNGTSHVPDHPFEGYGGVKNTIGTGVSSVAGGISRPGESKSAFLKSVGAVMLD